MNAFSKMKSGRNEPILDPDLVIVDTQHHLFERPHLRYLLDDYLDDVRAGHRIVASVYVETQYQVKTDGPQWLRPVGEVRFADQVAQSCVTQYCHVAAAIIGYCDLTASDSLAQTLEASLAAAPKRFRGVRQIAMAHPDEKVLANLTHRPPPDLLGDPRFEAGLSQLLKRGLLFEATVLHHQLPALTRIAARHPDLIIVLSHMGLAVGMGLDARGREEVFKEWRAGLHALANCKNVVCKIGGMGTVYWGFRFNEGPEPVGYQTLATAWRPYLETAIDCFGPTRCMMESDFPADGRSCGFVPLWNALKHCTRDFSRDERAALFHGTAACVYGLGLNP